MKKIIAFIFIVSLFSCSFSDSKKEEVGQGHDDLEFVVDSVESDITPSIELKVEEHNMDTAHPPQEEAAIVQIAEPRLEEFKNFPSPSEVFNKQGTYQIQKNDTLMLIAFKIYGDYRKWKDLKEWNREKLKSKLSKNKELTYLIPSDSFRWKPEGLAHLVKKGDTLQSISMDKYGTTRKWSTIYENNHSLIRDPNLIFAGFTIYYKPSRDLASRPR